ncbi:554_t:CDS:2 [Ambispora leptoticha]|uniref:554_t:CDS:1 n=1 Tax=Ambispora leptoticha TaxID=144679 RepID=A0A9N9FX25_9GLOM|nr:554_t:CDS:2 [Ambispora leptoticha]
MADVKNCLNFCSSRLSNVPNMKEILAGNHGLLIQEMRDEIFSIDKMAAKLLITREILGETRIKD